ncbi:hypothetical protein [Phenylobacterium sp.]|uniref:hypothetical protein n=1 Tax=Phenylobacterium sp. TaxID=1871053 RepID=UPI002810CE58|nr:hypothetical protein [Phenylobacterium sp.]
MSARWIATLVAAGVLLVSALGLYWKGRMEGSARERPKVDAALARAAVAGLEARAERDSAHRVEVVVRRRDVAARTVTQLTQDAMTSEDAHAPLAADRASRLRDHDRQLCLAAPELAGCAADPDAAGSQPAVRHTPASGAADPG